jgi:hypothetical protein
MLPEVAAEEPEQSTIVNPLRKLLRRVKSFIGTIEEVDFDVGQVLVSHGFDGHKHELPYWRAPQFTHSCVEFRVEVLLRVGGGARGRAAEP